LEAPDGSSHLQLIDGSKLVVASLRHALDELSAGRRLPLQGFVPPLLRLMLLVVFP
jgi:hypothetical protein